MLEKVAYEIPYQDGHKNLKTFRNSQDHSRVSMAISAKKRPINFMAILPKTKLKVDMLKYNKCHLVVSCSRETKSHLLPLKTRSKFKTKNPDQRNSKRKQQLRAHLRKFYSTIAGASPVYSLRSEKTQSLNVTTKRTSKSSSRKPHWALRSQIAQLRFS